MAIDLSFQADTAHDAERDDDGELSQQDNPGDLGSEEALLLAAQAWKELRTRFDDVDPSRLSPASREVYARLLARIGLWADARAFGEPIERDDTP